LDDDLRNEKFLRVVNDLLADHDDSKLFGQLYQATAVLALNSK
jgi:hypothetical protein